MIVQQTYRLTVALDTSVIMGETVSKPRIVIQYKNDYRLLDTAIVLGASYVLVKLIEWKNAEITNLGNIEQQLRDELDRKDDEFGKEGCHEMMASQTAEIIRLQQMEQRLCEELEFKDEEHTNLTVELQGEFFYIAHFAHTVLHRKSESIFENEK